LSLMGWNDLFSRFEFEKYDAIDNQVCAEVTNTPATEVNRHWNFGFNAEAFLDKDQAKRIAVNAFEKAKPKLVIHIVKDTNDQLG